MVAVFLIVVGVVFKGLVVNFMWDLGHEVLVVGVASLYWDVVAILVVDKVDVSLVGVVEVVGMVCEVTDTVMVDPIVVIALAKVILEVVW